jgi:Uma2 family endonuclease
MGMALTYEDYLEFPNDGRRYEILEGELMMTPAPSPQHQDVSINLEFFLYAHIRRFGLGKLFHAPFDVIMSNISIVQPDILFISVEKLSSITERGFEGAPDLVVEILSPATQRYDRINKLKIYASHGVKWYWLVSPHEKTLEEFELQEGGYTLRQAHSGNDSFKPLLFQGLTIELSEVWP